jgi:hypothetical protein
LHTPNLGQLLEDTTFFFGFKEALELTLFATEAFDLCGDTRWRHVQQNIGTVDPMDMGHHRVESTGRHVFKTQVLLDIFMKQFNVPLRRPL